LIYSKETADAALRCD